MSSFIKDLYSVALSKGGTIIFSIATTIIIARWLGPDLNGTIATLIVYPTLFMSIGSLGIRQSSAYYLGKGVYNENQIKSAIIYLCIVSTIVSVISCFFLIKYFSNSGNNNYLVLLAVAPIVFNLFNTFGSGLYLGKNQIQEFNKVNWLPPFFILIFTILLVVVFDLSIYGGMAAMVAGPMVMSFLMFQKIYRMSFTAVDFDWGVVKSLLSLGITYAISLLIINLNYKADIIMLDKLSTSYQTGIYSKGVALIEYLWHIPMLLSTLVFARSATSSNNREFSLKVSQLLRISSMAILIVSIFMAALAPIIIRILFGSDFIESSSVLVVLLPGIVLLTIFKVLNMDLAGRGKPWIALYAMAPALILNIGLNFIFIPKYGANGAALTSTISYALAGTIFIIVYSKEVDISVKSILTFTKNDFLKIKTIIFKVLKIKNDTKNGF